MLSCLGSHPICKTFLPSFEKATDKFHDKSETIDSNIDYFVYELEGFEIGLIDGHYPEYISIFNEAEWK